MAYTIIDFAPDTTFMQISKQTLVANTNKVIAIPKKTKMVHIYASAISTPIYFRINAPMTDISATPVEGGFLVPGTENVRVLYEKACAVDTDTLNLFSSSAGDFIIEFLG
jgi:hypothetical protein